jgi:hypothetical protein
MTDVIDLYFTVAELNFLGRLFQPPVELVDDLKPANQETQVTTWKRAEASLARKNFIRPASTDEEMTLDVTVAAMVSVLGDPQFALAVSTLREQAVEPKTWQLCTARGLIVDRHEDPAGTHTLTACRTREVAVSRVLDFLGLNKQPAAHTESFRILAEDLVQVPYIIAGNGHEDGASFLRGKGVPDTSAARLAFALGHPAQQSMVQAVAWQDGQPREIGRLTLLEEVYGLWLITPAEEDNANLVVTPITAAEAIERVRQLAFRVLPPEPE